jgi:CRP-like cAMP-binding protein
MHRRDEELAQLRAVPMLRPLPVPVMDHLARNLDRAHVLAGQTIFEQGDPGDRFFVIAAGEADVFRDGSAYRTLRRVTPSGRSRF